MKTAIVNAIVKKSPAMALAGSIRSALPLLAVLQDRLCAPRGVEEIVYRFYAGSEKVAVARQLVGETAQLLELIAAEARRASGSKRVALCRTFTAVAGTAQTGDHAAAVTGLLHARLVLDAVVRHGPLLDHGQKTISSGQAMVFALFGLR